MYGVTNIRAQEVSLRQLLEGYKIYQVPLFQRPYTWGKERWETLWDDLVDTYETNKTSTDTIYRHFLGPILTVAHPATPRGVAPYTIVDGQQRLVTVALLLAALRGEAEKCNSKPLPDDLFKNLPDMLNDLLKNRLLPPPDDLKIQPTHADRASFEAIVRPGGGGTTTGSLIKNVYNFFQKQLADWLKSHECSDLINLAGALLDQTVVVHITLGEKDSAYRIFESLNYKGVPLTVVDLVRNYLFMHLPTASAPTIHEKIWSPIEEEYKKNFPPSSKNSTRPLEEMSVAVWHYVRMDGKEIRKPDSYAALVEKHEDWVKTGKSTKVFIKDLTESLEDYLYFRVPRLEVSRALSERFEALIALKFGAVAPLVLALKKRLRLGKLSESTAARVLEVLEAYYVHRLLAGLPSNSLSRLVLEVLREGILDNSKPDDELYNFLKQRPRETRWPSKVEVQNGLLKENLEAYAPYLLRRIEKHLWKIRGWKETPTLDGLTLEHIMPKKLNETWKSELGADWARVHGEYLRTLPNLTLTGYNSEMGNKPFADKLDYLKESPLSLNKSYFGEQSAPAHWDENALKDRARWLTDIILKVWPM